MRRQAEGTKRLTIGRVTFYCFFLPSARKNHVLLCEILAREVMLYYDNNLLIQNDRAEMESANKLRHFSL